MTVALAVLLPSRRARSWTRVKIAKHFFEHRYDYRSEWLRFAATLGSVGSNEPLAGRIVRAFADILEAPAGLLLAPDDTGRLAVAGSWQWDERLPAEAVAGHGLDPLWQLLGDGRVLELDALRYRWGSAAELAMPIPAWLLDEQSLWVGVPLVHGDKAVGLVLLAAPELRRPLDWEDFDLLRTAGRQAAASLSEAAGQQRLSEARRFDEFNRRFAFILHDVKNLVSQLTLIARNAERHADNPEWRADMVATLRSSVGKMNDLLARLAPAAAQQGRPPLAAVELRTLLAGCVAAHRTHHDVRLLGDSGVDVLADPIGLEQAIGHLIANAVEASANGEPVSVRVFHGAGEARIEISDLGIGMDAEFVATRLFAPFASTKQDGFGIGAFEARTLVHAMGGRLTVDSRPGAGTRFTITLPLDPAELAELPERLTA
jgi:putative PEP-CTERM system histidine kinase